MRCWCRDFRGSIPEVDYNLSRLLLREVLGKLGWVEVFVSDTSR